MVRKVFQLLLFRELTGYIKGIDIDWEYPQGKIEVSNGINRARS